MSRNRIRIGYFEPTPMEITVEREPEVGIAWMACCKDLSLCALGDTPEEAGKQLLVAIGEKRVAGRGSISSSQAKDAERCL